MLLISVFYIAGFILFVAEVLQSEHISFFRMRYETRKEIILVWAILTTALVIYLINRGMFLELSVLILASLLLSIVMFRYEKYSARFILFINIILIIFSTTSLVLSNVEQSAYFEYLIRIIVFVIVIFLCIVTKTRFYSRIHLFRLLSAIAVGGLFGFWFSYMKEPMPYLFSDHFAYILFFSFIVALNEELIFRKLLFRFSKYLFSIRHTIIIQTILFTMLHLMDMVLLWNYYGLKLLAIYSVSLLVFGMVMGLLAEQQKEGLISPIYPIIAHTISNLIVLI